MLSSSSLSMAAPDCKRRSPVPGRAPLRVAESRIPQALVLLVLFSASIIAASKGSEIVDYMSPDGFRITASYYRPDTGSDRAIIIFPDPEEGRDAWASIAGTLSGRGYHVLVPELRGTGDSMTQRGIRRERTRFTDAEIAATSFEAQAAIRFVQGLQNANVQTVTLIGSGKAGPAARDASGKWFPRLCRILVSPQPEPGAKPASRSAGGHPLVLISNVDLLGIESAESLRVADPGGECWLLDAGERGADLLESRFDLFPEIILWIEQCADSTRTP
jgi:hypothetical protein